VIKKESLTQKVANTIRNEFLSARETNPGEFLPAERELAERFNVSRVTIRLSLKQLVNNGILEVVPKKGYRFIKPAFLQKITSIAYIVDSVKPGEPLDKISEQIMTAINRILMQRNQRMLSIGIKGISPDIAFFNKLKESNVQGILLDCNQPEVIKTVCKCNLPCVLINTFSENNNLDAVIQGNFNGTYNAVQYLISKNHRNIVWLGPQKGKVHYRERFSGARAAMENDSLNFSANFKSEYDNNIEAETKETEAFVTRSLKLKSPPSAFVCMWIPLAHSAINSIRKTKLKLGKNIEIIGWCTETEYRESFIPRFINETIPAMMIWSPNEMASVAIEALERRIKNPESPFVRIEVNARLQEPQSANKALNSKNLI
jgi:LacI family transcriptional regulator